METSSLDNLFDQISAINAMVGNPSRATWAGLLKQVTLLKHEVDELVAGVAARDLEETIDGQADVAFVLAGLQYMFRPLAPDLAEVVRSNMTKFDLSEEDAIKTKESYEKRGLKTRYEKRIPPEGYESLFPHETYFVTYVDGPQKFNGQDLPDGKWMKSINFEEPKFFSKPFYVAH